MGYGFSKGAGGNTGDSIRYEYSSLETIGTAASVFVWFRTTNSTDALAMLASYNGGSTHYWQINLNQKLNYVYEQYGFYSVFTPASDPGKFVGTPNSGWFDGSWHSFCMTRSTTNVTVYIDGANIGVTVSDPTGADSLDLLSPMVGGQQRPDLDEVNTSFDGDQAEYAMWTVALTPAEVASLHHIRPLHVRPESLINYVPLTGDKYDTIYGAEYLDWNTPTVLSDHPNVLNFQQPLIGIESSGVAPLAAIQYPNDSIPKDEARFHTFIAGAGGDVTGSLQTDYRNALGAALGYTPSQYVKMQIDDLFKEYYESQTGISF